MSLPSPGDGSRPRWRAAWLVVVALRTAVAQFGTIQIDWVAEGAADVVMPRLVGLEAERPTVADQTPPEDTYEEAWWRDGFAHDTPDVWFAASKEPRPSRPPSLVDLSHRVGTVYRHKLTGARGVIIGWDERTKAPRQWIAGNLPGERSWSDMLRRLYAPHYSVLEERRQDNGKLKFMQRYIVAHCREDYPEPCMRVESPAAPLQHPDTQKYFAGFDPERGYLPNAALEELYPDG